MSNLLFRKNYQVQAFDPKLADKGARAIRVQPEFSGGQVYAPFEDGLPKDWVQPVIDECAVAPNGASDDLLDSATQAIYWLRATNMLERPEEQFMREEESMKDWRQKKPLYNI